MPVREQMTVEEGPVLLSGLAFPLLEAKRRIVHLILLSEIPYSCGVSLEPDVFISVIVD